MYTVNVGNVGTVYNGTDWSKANDKYNAYVEISKAGVGRVGNEPVYFITDNEIMREYQPEVPNEL